MDEVFKYQESITNALLHANDKFQQVEQANNIEGVLSNAKDYHEKVVNIKKSLSLLKDRTSRLRVRAIKLIEEKKREDAERQRLKERREMLEKHLEPVVDTQPE
uniref:Pallidin n=1 Tax=Aceria tosichella TaxID=561515 RepID=A0A6G1SN59_9ACAR